MRLQFALPHQFKQAIEEKWPLLVPTGCIEYHGPHQALGLDTLLVEELLTQVAQRINCIVAPPFWYGPASYAVAGPEQGSIDVSTERFGRHVKDVLGGFWDAGFHRIIVGIHHQGMEGPETLAIRQAAAEIIFGKTQAERGNGWWGKAPLAKEDRLFERIQVWPTVLPQAQEQGVVMADHAGFFETSLLMAAHPELVELDRLGIDTPWYCDTPSSKASNANIDAGQKMWAAMVDAWVDKLSGL